MSLIKRLEKEKVIAHPDTKREEIKGNFYEELKDRIQGRIIEELSMDFNSEDSDNEELKAKIEEIILDFLEREKVNITRLDRERLKGEIIDETLGFGPITPLIKDKEVSEIMVNSPNQVYIEKKRKAPTFRGEI